MRALEILRPSFKISVFSYSILSFGLAIILSFNGFTISSAQDQDGYLREVRPIETGELGIDAQQNPGNITEFSFVEAVTADSASFTAESDFSIIALPDTQHYVDNPDNAPNFFAQTQWIVDHRVASNIQFVTHLGDIVDHGDNFGDDTEWLIADAAMDLLKDPVTTLLADGIPFGVAPGDHDQGNTGDGTAGQTVFFNSYFGVGDFQGRAYYGGHYGTSNDNNFELFSAGGMDFIIIQLEHDLSPRDVAVLNWADSLLTTYSDRQAIVVTHDLIDTGNPGPLSSQGHAIYDTLKDNPNLFLLLGGHNPGEGQRVDVFNSNIVYSLLSNYQSRANGGDGWLRIMEFSPANNEIRVKTYSPVLEQFETDTDSQFTLSFPLSVYAGPDQAIDFGESATLDGTVSDHRIPEPGGVTTAWSKVSGPGEVNFADSSSVDTTASFSLSGVYVLRLMTDDGALSAYDELTLTVNPQPPANQPPTANAGQDQMISLPEKAYLDGTVSDDGLPSGTLNTEWSVVSGPGLVTFADAHAVDTTASFPTSGVYTLLLTVSDGAFSSFNDITITVYPRETQTIWLPIVISNP